MTHSHKSCYYKCFISNLSAKWINQHISAKRMPIIMGNPEHGIWGSNLANNNYRQASKKGIQQSKAKFWISCYISKFRLGIHIIICVIVLWSSQDNLCKKGIKETSLNQKYWKKHTNMEVSIMISLIREIFKVLKKNSMNNKSFMYHLSFKQTYRCKPLLSQQN